MATRQRLQRIGFFRELIPIEGDGPSLVEAMGDTPAPEEERIVAYLEGGIGYIMSPGPVFDVLDGEGPIGTASVLTDGVWAWRDDLAAYVDKYHVQLPEDFVQHARANNWQIKDLGDDQLTALTL